MEAATSQVGGADLMNERLMGNEPPEVVARHTARYERAIGLAGRTDGVWWDVACGTGYGAALMPSEDVYAFDRNFGVSVGLVHFMATDIAQAGWSSEAPSPDVVVSIETLEHLDHFDQDGFVAEIAERIEPGGVLILSCPIGDGTPSTNPWHLHEPTERELRKLMSRHFLDVSIEVEHYESTSGPAVQAWAVAWEPR